jgi:hypothetical protein
VAGEQVGQLVQRRRELRRGRVGGREPAGAGEQGVEAIVVLGQGDQRGQVPGDRFEQRPDVVVLDAVVVDDLGGDPAQVPPQQAQPRRVRGPDQVVGHGGEPGEVAGHRPVHHPVVEQVGRGLAGRAGRGGGDGVCRDGVCRVHGSSVAT